MCRCQAHDFLEKEYTSICNYMKMVADRGAEKDRHRPKTRLDAGVSASASLAGRRRTRLEGRTASLYAGGEASCEPPSSSKHRSILILASTKEKKRRLPLVEGNRRWGDAHSWLARTGPEREGLVRGRLLQKGEEKTKKTPRR